MKGTKYDYEYDEVLEEYVVYEDSICLGEPIKFGVCQTTGLACADGIVSALNSWDGRPNRGRRT